MSQQVVLEIIDRAIKEEEFRTLLFTDPDTALASYEDLTAEEREILSNLDEKKLGEFAGELGIRITKGSWLPPGGGI